MESIRADEQQEVDEALQGALFNEAGHSLCLGVFVAFTAVLFLFDRVDLSVLFYWGLAFSIVSSLRLLLLLVVRQRGGRPYPIKAFNILMGLTGVLWGSITLLWSPSLDALDQLLIVLLPVFCVLGMIVPLGIWVGSYMAFVAGFVVAMLYTIFMHAEFGLVRMIAPLGLIVLCCLILSRRVHRQLREMLLLRLRNHRALRSKEDFLARMSHELRTPMNGVLGMARMLDKTQLSPEQQKLVSTLKKSGEEMMNQVADLLDASNLSSQGIKLSVEACDVPKLCEAVVESYVRKLGDKNVALNLTMDRSIPDLLVMDAQRWRQLCQKLLDNAVKFTDAGSIDVHLSNDNNKLILAIRDTGCGIAEPDIDRVGVLFYTAMNENPATSSGCGVGLTIAQGIVDLMEGSLHIESKLGEGTLVRVEVPMIPVNAPVDHQSEASLMDVFAAFGQGRSSAQRDQLIRVLVAEDNSINQMVVEALLKELGCDITLVENGLEALLALQAATYDIVFMDCQMPELDGYEATRQARENGYSLPIVAVTANDVAGSRERCMEAGMNDYICKPLAADTIELMLEKWVGRLNSESPLADAA